MAYKLSAIIVPAYTVPYTVPATVERKPAASTLLHLK